jgi:hypothetical protein
VDILKRIEFHEEDWVACIHTPAGHHSINSLCDGIPCLKFVDILKRIAFDKEWVACIKYNADSSKCVWTLVTSVTASG